MKLLTHLQIQLIKLLLYKPEDIRDTVTATNNIGYCNRFHNNLIPYRIGIEIDAAGYPKELNDRNNPFYQRQKMIKDYSPDNTSCGMAECNEIRFSVDTLKQYKHLKWMLDQFQASPNVSVAERGGLHIHVGFKMLHETKVGCSAFRLLAKEQGWMKPVQQYLFYLNNTIAKSKYKAVPNGNSRVDQVGIGSSGAIIIGRNTEFNTIEYRLMQPTFNYTTIMRSALCFQQMNKSLENKIPFNKALCDAILAL